MYFDNYVIVVINFYKVYKICIEKLRVDSLLREILSIIFYYKSFEDINFFFVESYFYDIWFLLKLNM